MGNATDRASPLTRLANAVRHPTKLRLVMCPIILVSWYFAFFSPLSDGMVETRDRIEKEQKRIAAARKVEESRKALNTFKDRVPANADLNELMQFVITRIRKSPLKLVDLKPDKPKPLGPYEVLLLRLSLEGTYVQIHELLNWVNREQRLMRVESLSLVPVRRENRKGKETEPFRLSVQLVLAALTERTVPEKPGEARKG